MTPDEEMYVSELARELSQDPTFLEEIQILARRAQEKLLPTAESVDEAFAFYHIVRMIEVKPGVLRPIKIFGPMAGHKIAIGKCAHINDVVWKKGRYDLFHMAVPLEKNLEEAYNI